MQVPFTSESALTRLYYGPIRAGQAGRQTDRSFTIWQVPESELAFLQPFPTPNYTTSEYREFVNGSAEVANYFKLHDQAQPAHLKLIQHMLKRGGVVADCGCGGGSLLDLVRGWAAETIAIEPFEGFHTSLRDRGHKVASSISQAAIAYEGRVDLALSFHVIEHTEDPVAYLLDIYSLLRPGGRAFVLTPNLDDILLKINFEAFAPFFFREVHNLYFNARALEWTARSARFKVTRSVHYHEFGLSNAFHWLRDQRPRGNTPMPGIDGKIDGAWRTYLEESGQANNVAVELEKPI